MTALGDKGDMPLFTARDVVAAALHYFRTPTRYSADPLCLPVGKVFPMLADGVTLVVARRRHREPHQVEATQGARVRDRKRRYLRTVYATIRTDYALVRVAWTGETEELGAYATRAEAVTAARKAAGLRTRCAGDTARTAGA